MPSPEELQRMDQEGFYRGSAWERGEPAVAVDVNAAVMTGLKSRLAGLEADLEQRKADKRNVKTPYVSIDIETTGIDHSFCQVIEIGAVVDDWSTPVEELPRWHCYVVHDRYVGEPYALSMHATIFRRIAERAKKENQHYLFLSPAQIAAEFCGWLQGQGFDSPVETAFTPAGKNFSGFDRQFLKLLPDFEKIKMHHRAIDPGNLYWNPDTDKVLPDSKQCLKRAGVGGEVSHTAIEDAIDVIKEVRFWYANRPAWTDRDIAKGLIASILDKADARQSAPAA